jgi:deoxyribodipyrimidine photo-lyase
LPAPRIIYPLSQAGREAVYGQPSAAIAHSVTAAASNGTGALPQLADLGLEPPEYDDRAVLAFKGGETAGLARLQHYIWQQDCLKVYKDTRNGMLGANYSSKFSPWLALGCLSPRYIYEQIQQYETERVQNDSTYWLVFELLWRDYFRFVCTKHGDRIFRRSGLQGIDIAWKETGSALIVGVTGQRAFLSLMPICKS